MQLVLADRAGKNLRGLIPVFFLKANLGEETGKC